jgi:hypothetical protein
MPFCNRTDTGFDVTRRESEPTSDRWYVARKLGEPLMWGKANGRCITGVCTSNIVDRHVQRLWVGIAKVARGAHSEFPGRHVFRLAFVLLEPSDGKLSRSVPRGLGACNRAWLPSDPVSIFSRRQGTIESRCGGATRSRLRELFPLQQEGTGSVTG